MVTNTACLCRGVELSSQHHTKVFPHSFIREDIMGKVAIESDLKKRIGIQDRFYSVLSGLDDVVLVFAILCSCPRLSVSMVLIPIDTDT